MALFFFMAFFRLWHSLWHSSACMAVSPDHSRVMACFTLLWHLSCYIGIILSCVSIQAEFETPLASDTIFDQQQLRIRAVEHMHDVLHASSESCATFVFERRRTFDELATRIMDPTVVLVSECWSIPCVYLFVCFLCACLFVCYFVYLFVCLLVCLVWLCACCVCDDFSLFVLLFV